MAYDLPAKGEDAVVHGEWLYYSTTMMRCSKCYRTVPVHRYGYCPHCGATMTRKWTL
jgi:rRNA maturation endonuclease Nob1